MHPVLLAAVSLGWGLIVLVNVGEAVGPKVSPRARDAIAFGSGIAAAAGLYWLFGAVAP